MYIGEAGAEGRAAPGIKQFERIEVIARSFSGEQRSEQDQQMGSRAFAEKKPARSIFNASIEEINGGGGQQAHRQSENNPTVSRDQERQAKDVKPDIEIELRIVQIERQGMQK